MLFVIALEVLIVMAILMLMAFAVLQVVFKGDVNAARAAWRGWTKGREDVRVIHEKTGRTYRILHDPATLEASLQSVVVYQSEHDGRVWVRPAAEFGDGRFQRLP